MDQFVADSMHGKLAKKLRFFGFDTLYSAEISSKQIIEVALEQNRVILTSNYEFHIFCKTKGINVILIGQESDLDNIILIGKSLNWKSIDDCDFSTRCTLCNGKLLPVEKEELKTEIQTNTFQNITDFFRCTDCFKIYWKGTHWDNMIKMAQLVNGKLQE